MVNMVNLYVFYHNKKRKKYKQAIKIEYIIYENVMLNMIYLHLKIYHLYSGSSYLLIFLNS